MMPIAHTLARAVRDFLRWWGAELLALLPGGLGRAFARRDEEWLLQSTGQGAALFVKRGEAVERIAVIGEGGQPASGSETDALAARLGREHPPVAAVFAREEYLRPRLSLPLAAEEDPREAVHYQVSRFSPFRPDDVLLDVRVLGRNPAAKTLDVEVSLLPKAAVETMRQRAMALGLTISRVALAGDASDGTALTYLACESLPRPRIAGRVLDAALAGVLLVLAGTVAAWPLVERHAAADRLRAEISRVEPKAGKASALRRDMESVTVLGRRIAETRAKTPLAIAVLARLSEILPGDVWLIEYRMRAGEVTITGFAPDATALLSLIEAAGEFESVKFSAATSRGETLGRDRFSMSFTVAASP